MEDFYKILEVNESASQDEIKKSYRKKSLMYHPDRPTGDAEKFKKINLAFETLGDERNRRTYDNERKNPFMRGGGFPGFSGGDPHDDILNMIFGSMGGMGGMGGNGGNIHFSMPGMSGMPGNVRIFRNGVPVNINRKPETVNSNLEILLEQAYSGSKIPLEIDRTVINNNQKQSEKEVLYVDIPIGIDNNEIITLSNKGNIINGIKGDIKITIKIKNNTNFIRKGLDLIYEKKITLKQSLIGFTFNIKHLSGKDYTINNNSNKIVTNEHINVIKNMGMRRERKHPASPIVGNLIIKFNIVYPEVITQEQRDALEKIL